VSPWSHKLAYLVARVLLYGSELVGSVLDLCHVLQIAKNDATIVEQIVSIVVVACFMYCTREEVSGCASH